MTTIWVLLAGGIGFTALVIYDALQLTPRSELLALASNIGSVGVALATFGTLFVAPWPDNPLWAWMLGIVAVALSVAFLWRSVYGEIRHAEIRRGEPRSVIDTGSYAVVRHPGFWPYAAMHAVIFLLWRDARVAVVGGALVLMDLLLVLIEDVWIFPRLLRGYDVYKQRVPMLIPRLWRRVRGTENV